MAVPVLGSGLKSRGLPSIGERSGKPLPVAGNGFAALSPSVMPDLFRHPTRLKR